jgi:hypothetical protein
MFGSSKTFEWVTSRSGWKECITAVDLVKRVIPELISNKRASTAGTEPKASAAYSFTSDGDPVTSVLDRQQWDASRLGLAQHR